MKLNNKGFAITSIIYGIMILFSLIMVALLGMLVSRNTRSEKLSTSTTKNLQTAYSYTINQTIYDGETYQAPYSGKYNMLINDESNLCSKYINKDGKISISDGILKINDIEISCMEEMPLVNSVKIEKIYSNFQNNIDKTGTRPDIFDGLVPIKCVDKCTVADKGNTDINNNWYDYANKSFAYATFIDNKNQANNLYNLDEYNELKYDGEYNGEPELKENYLFLDGIDDYIKINTPYDGEIDAITYIIKFMINTVPNIKSYYSLIGNQAISTENGSQILIGSNNDGSKATLQYRVSDGSQKYYSRAFYNLAINKIYTVIGTAKINDDKKVEVKFFLYEKGQQVSTATDNTSSTNLPQEKITLYNSKGYYIGASSHTDEKTNSNVMQRFGNLNIYSALIYGRAIEDEEVGKYVLNGYIDDTTDIIFHYNFSSQIPTGTPLGDNVFNNTSKFVWVPSSENGEGFWINSNDIINMNDTNLSNYRINETEITKEYYNYCSGEGDNYSCNFNNYSDERNSYFDLFESNSLNSPIDYYTSDLILKNIKNKE